MYLTILKHHHASSIAIILLVIVSVVSADIIAPYLVAQTLDALAGVANGTRPVGEAKSFFASFVVASLIGLTCSRMVGFWFTRRQARIIHQLERFLFERLTLHSYAFFANRFGGALVTQSNRFIRGYQTLEETFYIEIVSSLTRLFVTLAVLLVTIPSIGIALLVWAGFFIASVSWMVVKKQPYNRRASATDTFITARLADVITNILNLKSFGKRRDEVTSFRKLSDKRRKIQQLSWTIDEWVWSYTHVLGVGFAIITLWISITVVANGSASLASVLVAQFYLARTNGDLSNLQSIMNRIGRSFSDAAEMTQILNQPPEIQDDADPQPLKVPHGGVTFESVGFTYEGANPIFKNFSLEIAPGEKLGLVGHSGSGKSTLVKVLLRFANVDRGHISIDGQDIAKVAQDDLRANIGYVSQEPVLFHRSLAENIRYARPEATDKEVRKVAKLAHAAEFIEALPNGYDTLVGERGIKLSGGERQRVAIARAMLSAAPILVLDEATSSLDSASEKLITDALKELMKRRTTIVIAHRLSTIRNLDRIVVMDHGKIAEQGSHRQLLAKKGLYYELWQHQTGGFLGE